MRTRRRTRTLPRVTAIWDRGPSDEVRRIDGGLFLVDTNGDYAPVQLRDEEQDGWDTFVANTAKLTSAGQINDRITLVGSSPMLSEEGRQDRIQCLLDRWQELFGDAKFVVDDQERPGSTPLERVINETKQRRL